MIRLASPFPADSAVEILALAFSQLQFTFSFSDFIRREGGSSGAMKDAAIGDVELRAVALAGKLMAV